jgi:hypothetical protein
MVRLITKLGASACGLALTLVLGGNVAFAASPFVATGVNNVQVSQSIVQSAPSTAIANAVNFGRGGSAVAVANASPVQVANQNSVVVANNGPFIGRMRGSFPRRSFLHMRRSFLRGAFFRR